MNLVPRKFFLDDFFDDLEPTYRNMTMKCDIYEKDNKYFLEMDIPGYKKEDIDIDCENGYLTVTAEHEEKDDEEDKSYIRKERVYGKNVRKFYIGEVDDITAEFKDGILKVVVPKKEEINNKKKITIE